MKVEEPLEYSIEQGAEIFRAEATLCLGDDGHGELIYGDLSSFFTTEEEARDAMHKMAADTEPKGTERWTFRVERYEFDNPDSDDYPQEILDLRYRELNKEEIILTGPRR
jgi:hypothetical protein